jgi:hypothetical protein
MPNQDDQAQNKTQIQLRELELRVLKLEQSEQRRTEAGIEFLRKMAISEPGAKLPDTQKLAEAAEKTRKAIAKLERKIKYRKPRRKL